MLNDHLQKVRSGDPLQISAATWNSMIDAALDARFGKRIGGQPHSDPISPNCRVIIQNDTGANINEFSVLRITGSPFTSYRFPLDLQGRPCLSGNTPNASTNLIAITAEAIPAGQLGQAVVQGVAVADVLINDAGHEWAVPINGDSTKLSSATSGPVRIAAKEASGSTRKCIVVLGDGQGSASGTIIQEVDGSPTGTWTALKVPNGSLTDNGDGTSTLNFRVPWTGTGDTLTLKQITDVPSEVGGMSNFAGLEASDNTGMKMYAGLDDANSCFLAAMFANSSGTPLSCGFAVVHTDSSIRRGQTATVNGMVFFGGLYYSGSVEVNDANWSGTALAIANGGTGAANAGDARTNLGLGSLAALEPAADVDPLADSTGGTPGATLNAVGDTSAGDESPTINDDFASLNAKLNEIISALQAAGIMAS